MTPAIIANAARNLAALPAAYRALRPKNPYPVEMSEGIIALRERVSQAHRRAKTGAEST